jgi:putative transcriptional regulator
MTTLGKRLVQSAKEARKIVRGEADAKSYKMHIPAEIDVEPSVLDLK